MNKIKQCKSYSINDPGNSRSLFHFLELINYKNYKNKFIDSICDSSNLNIMEIGCGFGILINELNSLFNNHNYYAINMPHSSNIGYQKRNYTNKYIIDFMKSFDINLVNKKMVNHKFEDMYIMNNISNNYMNIMYSQSCFGKSVVSIKETSIIKDKIEKLLLNIINKLTIEGELVAHIDSIKYYDYEENHIITGTTNINSINIFYDIYFSDNKISQAHSINNTEVCIYLKKNFKKEKIETEINQKNIDKCKDSIVYFMCQYLNK